MLGLVPLSDLHSVCAINWILNADFLSNGDDANYDNADNDDDDTDNGKDI